jgi:hypothetical protein
MATLIYAIWLTAAFLAAVFVIFGIFFAKWGIRFVGETRTLQTILILVTIGATVLHTAIRISAGVDVDDPRVLSQIEEGVGSFVWAKRFITMTTLLITFSGLLRVYRRPFLRQIAGRGLLYGYLTFVLLSYVLGAVFSTIPAFMPQLFLELAVLLLVFLSTEADMRVLLSTARTCLGLVLIGSLLLAAIPKWGFVTTSGALIPGLPSRLAGMTYHPNALSPLALLYMLLAITNPIRKPWLQYCMYAIAFAIIVLAQSKTVWIAGILGVALVMGYRFFSSWKKPSARSSGWLVARAVAGLAAFTLSAVVAVLAIEGALPIQLFHHKTIADLTTLSGRTGIWNIT